MQLFLAGIGYVWLWANLPCWIRVWFEGTLAARVLSSVVWWAFLFNGIWWVMSS